jgi:hypothetical protein
VWHASPIALQFSGGHMRTLVGCIIGALVGAAIVVVMGLALAAIGFGAEYVYLLSIPTMILCIARGAIVANRRHQVQMPPEQWGRHR